MLGTRWSLFGGIVAAGLVVSAPARGVETAGETALCDRAILRGAATAGIPAPVLNAISLTETGRNLGGRLRPWPWAINREGKGYWFSSRDEALAFARASVAAGRTSFDVGCFQINYRWHGANFPNLESMFDQDRAANYAASFLRGLHAELGSWSAAAGAYHSRTPSYANIYRARFDRILASNAGAQLVEAGATLALAEAPATPRKSRERTRRPLIITIEPGSLSSEPVKARRPAEGERVEAAGPERTYSAPRPRMRMASR